MEIIVPLQVKVFLPEDKIVPIENLVSMLKNLKIDAKVLEQIINSADAEILADRGTQPIIFLFGK